MNRSEVKSLVLTDAYNCVTSAPIQDIEHFHPSESSLCPLPVNPLLPEAVNAMFCFVSSL